MKLFSGKSRLDEMQEQTNNKIGNIGFWLAWGGLLVALFAQQAAGAPFSQWAGEFILFMALCLYSLAASIYNGIWDRFLAPNTKTNLFASVLGGVAAAAVNLVISSLNYGFYGWISLLGAVFVALFTAVLIFVLLQLSLALYKKRHTQLEVLDETADAAEPEQAQNDKEDTNNG